MPRLKVSSLTCSPLISESTAMCIFSVSPLYAKASVWQAALARWASVLLLVALVVLVNLPNFAPWERVVFPQTYLIDYQERLLKCVLLTALYFCVFRRLWLAWLILWLSCLWWAPLSLSTRLFNATPITPTLLGMASETHAGELLELLQMLPAWVWGMLLGLNVVFWVVFWVLRRQSLSLTPGTRWVAGIGAGVLALLLIEPHDFVAVERAAAQALPKKDLFIESETPTIMARASLSKSFPFELASALREHREAQQAVAETVKRLQDSQVALQYAAGAPSVVVLVIGESSSREDWQLFNSAAPPTTPRLFAREQIDAGLLKFPNVLTPTTATRYAVPSMLSDQPIFAADGAVNSRATRSIVSIAGKAGLATAWYTTQAPGGRHDGPIAVYAKEAQALAYLNPANHSNQGNYDETLLPMLLKHLDRSKAGLVVLHTMGSHFRFNQRYPPEFERFKPVHVPVERDEWGQDVGIRNAYRNTVLYTDHVLAEVIQTIEATGQPAALVYVSDHGQGLREPGCDVPAVNRVMARAYEVPALVWLSPTYREANPHLAESLRVHRDRPYLITAVFQTLLDLMGGDASLTQTVERQSFARATSSYKREVVSSSGPWVDFDEAAARSRCAISPPSSH